MDATDPVDDWRPPWRSFQDFLADGPADGPYLTELDHEADTRREWSRAQWRDRVAGVAEDLRVRGLTDGDSVAVLAGNSADALAVAFACWASGICYLPLNAHETADRHAFILRDAGARLLVHTPSGAERADELARATGIPVLPATDLVTPATAASTGRRASTAADLPEPVAGLDSPALRVYTSGTTGEPKGVELSAANLLTDCDALERVLTWSAETRVLVVLPIHHVNGLVVSSLLSWYAGASAVLCDRFRSDRFWKDVEAEQATACSMVPTLLEFLLTEDRRVPPAHFQEVLCGAGPLMCDTVDDFEQSFGIPVRHLYGLSETTAVATLMPTLPDAERRGWYREHGFPSIGRALPHVAVAVHDADGRPCGAGQRGEIVIRGATVMAGYAGRPDATATALRDGWFHSGDEGFWLADDAETPYFFVTGRIKELIIRGGVNISPFQVDEVLRAHPAVQFGLAVPFENRYYGEEIAAYVVPATAVTEQEILDFCAERLDFAYQPKVVLFGDDVPFTATGKAKRLTLREQLQEQLADYRDVQFRRRPTSAAAQEGKQDA
jgi:long-chain acyl-CoA synthetase